MSLLSLIRLRSRRRYLLARAFRRRRQLAPVADRTAGLPAQPILLFSTMRNERIRLPYFLSYYRRLGVDHFLIVDNGRTMAPATTLPTSPTSRSGPPPPGTGSHASAWTG